MVKNEEIRKKIIVVDDIQFHLLSIKERLKKSYEIYPAQNAETLFRTLQNVMPGLILLDINMPGTDGYEVVQRIKSDSRFSHIPVIFLTSNTDKKSAVKALKHGAADFVTKPFSDADLIECIEYQFHPEKFVDRKPIILAVDDNPVELRHMNERFGKRYTVYTLAEPKKLSGFLKFINPDLFLIDCQMSDMSGLDMTALIRDIEMHEDTPIILISSEGTSDDVSDARSRGVTDFIVKPTDEKVLQDKVASRLKNFMIWRHVRELRS